MNKIKRIRIDMDIIDCPVVNARNAAGVDSLETICLEREAIQTRRRIELKEETRRGLGKTHDFQVSDNVARTVKRPRETIVQRDCIDNVQRV